jgi:streptogramin lyase/DNA-directed RNA polymerase subunit RPC12/RpoP
MERSEESSPIVFHCPNCGAALPIPDTPTVRCQYCGTIVLVPPKYRSANHPEPTNPPAQVFVPLDRNMADSVRSNKNPFKGILSFVIIMVIVCIVIAGVLSSTGVLTTAAIFGGAAREISQQSYASQATNKAAATTAPSATPIPPVSVDLVFGGDGTGPGQFDDPRYVAVDTDGNLFVGDYSDGRIQKFDPSGNFLMLINVEPDRNDNILIRSMTADYRGNLYIARGGDLLIYATQNGEPTGSIPGQFPSLNHDQVVADPANNLYAVNTSQRDGLIKYDPKASILWSKDNVLEDIVQKNKPYDLTQLVVDGVGNIFILNRVGYEIYKINSQGTFLDRFGSKGKGQQQFNNPSSIAVDGKGRIFVVDSEQGYLLKVFDSNGTYLKSLPWPKEITYPYMILFDVRGNLYAVTNTSQVARMKIKPEALEN